MGVDEVCMQCEICGEYADLEVYKGKAICYDCYLDLEDEGEKE